jgi:hypothetical protein
MIPESVQGDRANRCRALAIAERVNEEEKSKLNRRREFIVLLDRIGTSMGKTGANNNVAQALAVANSGYHNRSS